MFVGGMGAQIEVDSSDWRSIGGTAVVDWVRFGSDGLNKMHVLGGD